MIVDIRTVHVCLFHQVQELRDVLATEDQHAKSVAQNLSLLSGSPLRIVYAAVEKQKLFHMLIRRNERSEGLGNVEGDAVRVLRLHVVVRPSALNKLLVHGFSRSGIQDRLGSAGHDLRDDLCGRLKCTFICFL